MGRRDRRALIGAEAALRPACALLHLKATTVAMRARSASAEELADGFGRAAAAAPSSAAAAQHYVTALLWAGQADAAARAAQHGVMRGLWGTDVAQRPARFVRGLRARTYWPTAEAAPAGLCRRLPKLWSASGRTPMLRWWGVGAPSHETQM